MNHPRDEARTSIALAAVDEFVLDELVRMATADAAADDVTPRTTPGPNWTPEREQWLRDFHCERRPGLVGPLREATWAVLVDGRVVGSVRLKQTDEDGVVEAGIWLTRSVRGQGAGAAATAALLELAGDLGANAVRADTTPSNLGALSLLRRCGFLLTHTPGGRTVEAIRRLQADLGSPP